MQSERQVVALAGVGDVGKYTCEELLADDRFSVVVLSRSAKSEWFEERNINVRITDYTESSLVHILDSIRATALISFIQLLDDSNVEVHRDIINACLQSKTCKRIIPSEWIGNIDDFPTKPEFLYKSREPIRKMLRETKGLQWTLFNQGFFMDYFLPASKTYLRSIPGEFPVDPNAWDVCIRGTGDEPQTFTTARDVGRAVRELLLVERWDPVTYVAGEWTTFNKAVKVMEAHYGRLLPKTNKSRMQIEEDLIEAEKSGDADRMLIAQVDDWMVSGGNNLPKEKTLQHRKRFFSNIEFSTLQKVLERMDKTCGV